MKRRRSKRAGIEIRPGVGTRCGQIGRKFYVSARDRLRRAHAWKYSEAESGLTIALGLVNGMEPSIIGRPMSGLLPDGTEDPRGIPVLPIDLGAFDQTGRSWVCVRIEVDKDGKLLERDLAPQKLSIVQSRVRYSSDERVGLQPIVFLRLVGDVWEARQISYFDFQHGTSRTAEKKLRHFFDPA